MKILEANAGALTQFEVLDFLKSRGASSDPTRVIAPIAPSEFQVYDYLIQKAACNQTRESVKEFLKRCEKFDLAKAEKLNIIDIRPSSVVEIDPIIEECEKRMGSEVVDELVQMVAEIFPPVQRPDQEAQQQKIKVARETCFPFVYASKFGGTAPLKLKA